MKFERVLELIKAVSESNVTTFKYEEGETKLLIRTEEVKRFMPHHPPHRSMREATCEVALQRSEEQEMDAQVVGGNAIEGNVVSCPLVGTFYTASSEEAEPFVKAGDVVKKGQTLAIVEAMKLMNEIESEFDGQVVEILAQNAQGVEYGQPLFIIK